MVGPRALLMEPNIKRYLFLISVQCGKQFFIVTGGGGILSNIYPGKIHNFGKPYICDIKISLCM